MSAGFGYIKITCDNCGYSESTKETSASYARAYAVQNGWSVAHTNDGLSFSGDPEGKDYCPDCVKKIVHNMGGKA